MTYRRNANWPLCGELAHPIGEQVFIDEGVPATVVSEPDRQGWFEIEFDDGRRTRMKDDAASSR